MIFRFSRYKRPIAYTYDKLKLWTSIRLLPAVPIFSIESFFTFFQTISTLVFVKYFRITSLIMCFWFFFHVIVRFIREKVTGTRCSNFKTFDCKTKCWKKGSMLKIKSIYVRFSSYPFYYRCSIDVFYYRCDRTLYSARGINSRPCMPGAECFSQTALGAVR